MPRNALGKGLSALIREPELASAPFVPPLVDTSVRAAVTSEGVLQADIDLIDPSPYQPRVRFREEALEELMRSIQASGIIQPLLVRRRGGRFQLIAGERRWRAAQRAGLQHVPVVVREVPEELALEITLVENLQREDLNPIEQAAAFDRLISEFHLTQEQVAERTGKDRATIANALRLLKLDEPIRQLLEEGSLTAGHGRALLALQDAGIRITLAKRAARGGLTVRQIERIASRAAKGKPTILPLVLDANTRAAIEELQRSLGTKVTIRPQTAGRPGQLIIEYYDDGQLARLYDRILGR
jgi:ParB family transcriptional regulator, chromosome partitioning protein